MRSTYKSIIPYIIIAVLLAVIAVVLLFFPLDKLKKEPETTTLPPETVYNPDGSPYYPDVEANSYNVENFVRLDNGRMTYTDDSVKYYTGIDVSQFQGDIDWNAVAADGISFAIIRVGARGYGSSGVLIEDENYAVNLKNAHDAGLKTGVYFYSQAVSVEEAREEAEYVLSLIKGYDITAPVVFDWENMPDVDMRTDNVDGSTVDDCAIEFCNIISNAGYQPAIYFNLSDGYTRYDLSRIKDFTFWYAQYEGDHPEFAYDFAMWQYTSSGTVNGIDTDVDINISFTDFE